MHSPAGYTPLSELNVNAKWDEHLSHDEVAARILDVGGIFATNAAGIAFRLSEHILATHLGRFAFVDPNSWVVSLPRPGDFRNEIRGDLQLYAGGFTSVDAEYDERLGNILSNLPISEMKSSGADNRLPDNVPDGLVIEVAKLDGSPICMTDGDFAKVETKLLADLKTLAKNPSPIRHATPEDEERAYKEFITPYVDDGTRATMPFHEEWQKQNSISRKRLRELRKLFAPTDWQRPGAQKG